MNSSCQLKTVVHSYHLLPLPLSTYSPILLAEKPIKGMRPALLHWRVEHLNSEEVLLPPALTVCEKMQPAQLGALVALYQPVCPLHK